MPSHIPSYMYKTHTAHELFSQHHLQIEKIKWTWMQCGRQTEAGNQEVHLLTSLTILDKLFRLSGPQFPNNRRRFKKML